MPTVYQASAVLTPVASVQPEAERAAPDLALQIAEALKGVTGPQTVVIVILPVAAEPPEEKEQSHG